MARRSTSAALFRELQPGQRPDPLTKVIPEFNHPFVGRIRYPALPSPMPAVMCQSRAANLGKGCVHQSWTALRGWEAAGQSPGKPGGPWESLAHREAGESGRHRGSSPQELANPLNGPFVIPSRLFKLTSQIPAKTAAEQIFSL